jgi:ferredoxin-NADP reductase
LRSYSLSDLPDAGRYRITIKQEPHGIASTYVSTRLRAGDVLDVSAPRGAFILKRGDLPVVLLSAGVGVTPVMAMLHALAAQASPPPVWWIYGARNSGIILLHEKHAICWLSCLTPGATSSTADPTRPTGWAWTSMLPAG